MHCTVSVFRLGVDVLWSSIRLLVNPLRGGSYHTHLIGLIVGFPENRVPVLLTFVELNGIYRTKPLLVVFIHRN